MRGVRTGWLIAGFVFGTVVAASVRGLWGALDGNLPPWAAVPLCALYVVVVCGLFRVGYRLDRQQSPASP